MLHSSFENVNIVAQDVQNLETFCNLEVMWGLSCIMPMLEGLNDLIKILIVSIMFCV